MTDKTVDYIKIKVFLYKYNPVFTYIADPTNKDSAKLQGIKNQIDVLQKQEAVLQKQIDEYNNSDTTQADLIKQWNIVLKRYQSDIFLYENFVKGNPTLGISGNPNAPDFTSIIKAELNYTPGALDYLSVLMDDLMLHYIKSKLEDIPATIRFVNTINLVLKGEDAVISKGQKVYIDRKKFLKDTYIFIKLNLLPTQMPPSEEKLVGIKTQIISLKEQESKFLQGLSRISRFSIDLDEDRYFSKVDISDFVTSYHFSQSIRSEINWSVDLFNGTLDEKNMGKYFLRRGNNLMPRFKSIYSTLADYETEDDNFMNNYDNEVATINIAMNERSKNVTTEVTQQASDKDKSADISARQPQVLLSDLIQKFDFISCYIYKHPDPIDEDQLNLGISGKNLASQGVQEEAYLMQKGFSNEFNGFVLSKTVTRQVGSLNTLAISGSGSFCLFDRTKVLYSPTLFTKSLYDQAELFDTEQLSLFSSLYSDKKITTIIDSLLRDVYRIIPTSQDPLLRFSVINTLAANDAIASYNKKIQSLADSQRESIKAVDFAKRGLATANPNNKSKEYWQDKIAEAEHLFQVKYQVSSIYGLNFTVYHPFAYDVLQSDLSQIKQTYFFDIARIKIENGCNTNIFNIPAFLLSLVMKAKGFYYRDTTNAQVSSAVSTINGQTSAFKTALGKSITNYMLLNFPSDTISFISPPDTTAKNIASGFYGPVLMQINVDQLVAYFRFLDSGFSNFNPILYTPNQILDEIKAASFIEIFETSGGTLVIRPPKYNDDSTTLFSGSYNVISTQYIDTIKNVVAKEKLTYHPDLIKNIPFNIFAYTNGKLLEQFGLTETNASANPNVRFAASSDAKADVNKSLGIFNYARFFLELNNAAQKTSAISIEYVPATTTIKNPITGEATEQAFGIGNLFFDEINNKLSYIIGIDKSCRIGDIPTMSLTGTYVRDAFKIGSAIQFRLLPELIDLNNLFATQSEFQTDVVKKPVPSPIMAQAITAEQAKSTSTTIYINKGK